MKQKKKFNNFPSAKDPRSSPQFKLSPDMPFSFSSDDRAVKDQTPTVTFKNAEDLRYQNDYYQLPEPDDFQLQNEIFQDFEAPKIKRGRSEDKYFQSRSKQIKYSEPLNYRNPLDKYHNKMDVEIFEVPSLPFTVEDISYSNYKSNPHFVDLADKGPSLNQDQRDVKLSRSQALYRPSRGEERPREETDQMYFHNDVERDLPENFYDIPKIPADNYDEHLFSLPDVGRNADYQPGPVRQPDHYNSDGQGYKRETSDFRSYNEIDYKDYYDYEYKEKEYESEYTDPLPPQYQTPRPPPPPPPPPQYQTPDPLPPPPAIIEMQHDSVFAGNFDVPKLGVAGDYKPPEVVYNEMFEKKENSFSNLLPQGGPDKLSRSLQYKATPSPFLPTPSRQRRPLADYSHLYKSSKREEETKIPPYTPPTPRYRTYEETTRNYFKPRTSPSLTFEKEPEYSNEIFDEDRELYEKLHGGKPGGDFLHAVGQYEPEYEEYEGPVSREDFPVRPERVGVPQSSSYQRSELTADVGGGPRYKRYQAVDYTPQHLLDYNQLFGKPAEPYKPEPYIPYAPPTPAYPTPAPYHHHPPTEQPDYFKHQLPEFPAPPDNFLHSEPEIAPDYYESEYGQDYNYNSPSYKTYELDTYEPNYHNTFANIDIPKLDAEPGNYNQFVNVAGHDAFEHGHVRGNPEHKKQEYSRREGRHFKSQVSNKVAGIQYHHLGDVHTIRVGRYLVDQHLM